MRAIAILLCMPLMALGAASTPLQQAIAEEHQQLELIRNGMAALLSDEMLGLPDGKSFGAIVYHELIMHQYHLQDVPGALRSYDEALKRGLDLPMVRMARARLWLGQAQLTDAEGELQVADQQLRARQQQVAAMDPADVSAWGPEYQYTLQLRQYWARLQMLLRLAQQQPELALRSAEQVCQYTRLADFYKAQDDHGEQVPQHAEFLALEQDVLAYRYQSLQRAIPARLDTACGQTADEGLIYLLNLRLRLGQPPVLAGQNMGTFELEEWGQLADLLLKGKDRSIRLPKAKTGGLFPGEKPRPAALRDLVCGSLYQRGMYYRYVRKNEARARGLFQQASTVACLCALEVPLIKRELGEGALVPSVSGAGQ